MRGGPARAIGWLFRDRRTGRITIAQFPNAALGLFLTAWALRWLLNPAGAPDTVLRVTAVGALLWWALDELIRGVNPWRRLLGASVLAGQVVGILA